MRSRVGTDTDQAAVSDKLPKAHYRLLSRRCTLIWFEEVQVSYAQCNRQLVHSNYRRISAPLLNSANVLLAKTRNLRKFLLREAPNSPDPPDVLANQLAHVHAPRSA